MKSHQDSVENLRAALLDTLPLLEECLEECVGTSSIALADREGDSERDCEEFVDEEERARAFVELLNSPEGSLLSFAMERLTEALEGCVAEQNREALRSGWLGKPGR